MGFNENAFMIAGTAIAIFGVGLYIYDTRKEKITNSYNQYNPYKSVGGTKRKTRKNKLG